MSTEQVEYEIVRTRRRTLELRVYPDSRVEVRAPLRASRGEIDAFVSSREQWLKSRLARFAAVPRVSDEERFRDGSEHPWLGERITLRLLAGRGAARFNGQVLSLAVSDPTDWRKVEGALDRWYRRQAVADFQERLERLFPLLAARGHDFPTLKVRSMRSRWGSMSARTGMTLALELIRVPPECIDYVIVHELCHLEHMNHGPKFKALMTRLMPDWPERRRRLNRHPLR